MSLHIAVIEDDVTYQATIAEILNGFSDVEKVAGFSKAEDFLAAHEKASFDLALLDITLPGISGLQALKQLGEDPLPVVILSSSTDQKDVDEAYDQGARGYLVKPISLDELEDLLEDIVSMWSRMARPSPDATA